MTAQVGATPILVDDSAKIPVIHLKGLTYRVTHPPSSTSMRSEEPADGDAADVAIDVAADGGLSDGMTGIPPESMVDSESDGLGVGKWEEKGEDDDDFVMEQNQSDDEEAVPPVKGKQVTKGRKDKVTSQFVPTSTLTHIQAPPCGTFRQEVQELCQKPAIASAIVSSNKRKDIVMVDNAPRQVTTLL